MSLTMHIGQASHIAYDFNVNTGHTNEYEKYLELCNVLELPTSDQITDIVLHN